MTATDPAAVVVTGYEGWLTPAQAAARLGVTVGRVRVLCDTGKLTHARLAAGRLIDPASVDARQPTPPPAAGHATGADTPPRQGRSRTGRNRA